MPLAGQLKLHDHMSIDECCTSVAKDGVYGFQRAVKPRIPIDSVGLALSFNLPATRFLLVSSSS